MSLQLCRPPVSELVFQLFNRPLHPELFDILAAQTLQRDDQLLTLRITRTGHVIVFECRGAFLTEVLAAADDPLPERHRLLQYRVRREQHASASAGQGVQYQTSFQIETLPLEIFLHVHDEIVADGEKRGFLHHFQPHHRLSLSPLGFITVEGRKGSIVVHTFHTFPEENTVVKSQSLIEWRR